jgi:hypothetical protein
VFPQSLESLIFLVVACFIGFVIGQWIKNRGKKPMAEDEPITKMESTHQKKRVSKKERLKARRQMK